MAVKPLYIDRTPMRRDVEQIRAVVTGKPGTAFEVSGGNSAAAPQRPSTSAGAPFHDGGRIATAVCAGN